MHVRQNKKNKKQNKLGHHTEIKTAQTIRDMIYDLQKASFLKRLGAYLLDFILLLIITTGVACIISAIVDYTGHANTVEAIKNEYETTYGVDFDISQEDFLKLTPEEQQKITYTHDELFAKDKRVVEEYNLLYSFMLLITSISLFVAHLIMEFIVPLFLKNGQTLGKKVFGIAVMHTNGVRMRHFTLFARSILGKYTIETMVPVMIAIMIFFGIAGITGFAILLAMLAIQIVLLCVNKYTSCIHDILAKTVVVDLSSQLIFDTEEDMLAYIAEQEKKKAQNATY